MAGNLLFDMLSLPARQAIISSMTPLTVKAGTDIIKQGDTNATKFYVLERGACDVFVESEAWSGARKVHAYRPARQARFPAAVVCQTMLSLCTSCNSLAHGLEHALHVCHGGLSGNNHAMHFCPKPQRVWGAGAALLGAPGGHGAGEGGVLAVGHGARRLQRRQAQLHAADCPGEEGSAGPGPHPRRPV